jgi:hypothetical protein
VLPARFCWTRYGAEAGESDSTILLRKERERVTNGGVFLWGIGNAIGPSIRHLLAHARVPEVLFSPIRSQPRPQDVSPEKIVRWHMGRTLDGQVIQLPVGSFVTSGAKSSSPQRRRYALICSSAEPIRRTCYGHFYTDQVSNILTGRPVGASQVTAIVCTNMLSTRPIGTRYQIAMRAVLVPPYFVELAEAEEIKRARRPVIDLKRAG